MTREITLSDDTKLEFIDGLRGKHKVQLLKWRDKLPEQNAIAYTYEHYFELVNMFAIKPVTQEFLNELSLEDLSIIEDVVDSYMTEIISGKKREGNDFLDSKDTGEVTGKENTEKKVE